MATLFILSWLYTRAKLLLVATTSYVVASCVQFPALLIHTTRRLLTMTSPGSRVTKVNNGLSDASAKERVFGVTELLETIILNLSMTEMARAQQVCRQWKSVIEYSRPIRQALFLEPGRATDTKCKIMNFGEIDELAVHPALRLGAVDILGANAAKFDPLSRIYLAQPPGGMTVAQYRCVATNKCKKYCGWRAGKKLNIDCEAGETFGSLVRKMRQADNEGSKEITRWWEGYILPRGCP